MTQEIIVWSLLIGLIGLIWVVVLAILGDDHPTHDRAHGSASPKKGDRCKPHEPSPEQSGVAV